MSFFLQRLEILRDMPDPREIIVEFPDFFVGFLAPAPILNTNYAAVRKASEDSMLRSSHLFKKVVDYPYLPARSCDLTARQTRAIIDCNFSYFAAVMVPFADAELLRIICGELDLSFR